MDIAVNALSGARGIRRSGFNRSFVVKSDSTVLKGMQQPSRCGFVCPTPLLKLALSNSAKPDSCVLNSIVRTGGGLQIVKPSTDYKYGTPSKRGGLQKRYSIYILNFLQELELIGMNF